MPSLTDVVILLLDALNYVKLRLMSLFTKGNK